MEILPFLLWPFLASLILTGIHAYLGVHVVERGVIFVDLALAQIAALGAVIAILLGMDVHGQGAYLLSLAFTFIGAAIFAFARARAPHIPQEAFIGIAYAVASAAAILAMSKATGETEHLKDMLVGNILAVDRAEVLKTALLYGLIGLFHYLFRHNFLLISTDPVAAEARGLNLRFWDFLFYASFGLVVTSSVSIAGVLLVFCYLIVPAVGAMLLAENVGPRLAIGWTMGTVVSALGVYFSVLLDLPTGATIVCTFGGVLLLVFIAHLVFYHGPRGRPLKGAISARAEDRAYSAHGPGSNTDEAGAKGRRGEGAPKRRAIQPPREGSLCPPLPLRPFAPAGPCQSVSVRACSCQSISPKPSSRWRKRTVLSSCSSGMQKETLYSVAA